MEDMNVFFKGETLINREKKGEYLFEFITIYIYFIQFIFIVSLRMRCALLMVMRRQKCDENTPQRYESAGRLCLCCYRLR